MGLNDFRNTQQLDGIARHLRFLEWLITHNTAHELVGAPGWYMYVGDIRGGDDYWVIALRNRDGREHYMRIDADDERRSESGTLDCLAVTELFYRWPDDQYTEDAFRCIFRQ